MYCSCSLFITKRKPLNSYTPNTITNFIANHIMAFFTHTYATDIPTPKLTQLVNNITFTAIHNIQTAKAHIKSYLHSIQVKQSHTQFRQTIRTLFTHDPVEYNNTELLAVLAFLSHVHMCYKYKLSVMSVMYLLCTTYIETVSCVCICISCTCVLQRDQSGVKLCVVSPFV